MKTERIKGLFKPRLQNKLILAFLFIGVLPMTLSIFLVVELISYRMEREIEKDLKKAQKKALTLIEDYTKEAPVLYEQLEKRPDFLQALQGAQGKADIIPLPKDFLSQQDAEMVAYFLPKVEKEIKEGAIIEVQEEKILLTGVKVPWLRDGKATGMVIFGFLIGKGFVQDLEDLTEVDVQLFHEMPSFPSVKVLFIGDSISLTPLAHEQIKKVAEFLKEKDKVKVILGGHTDSKGLEAHNFTLGRKRAKAVKKALISNGVDSHRITAISFGETRPVASNEYHVGRRLNRRVEFEFMLPEEALVSSWTQLPMTREIKEEVITKGQYYYDPEAYLKGMAYRAIYQPLKDARGQLIGLLFLGLPKRYTFTTAVGSWLFFPVLLFLGATTSALLGYHIARGISKPIRLLAKGVLAVADGDLNQEITISSREEIGQLAKAFNLMTGKLRQLRQLEEEARRKDRFASLGQMAAGIAHEIRNPLSIIKSSAELLKSTTNQGAKRQELVNLIVEEVGRLNTIVTSFLEFSKPQHLQLQKGCLNEVLEKTIALMEPQAEAKGIRIEKDLDKEIPSFEFDPHQCHQIFVNIILNSIQAMEEKGGTLKVYTHFISKGGKKENIRGKKKKRPILQRALKEDSPLEAVEISFVDQGVGISEEDMPKLFTPFFSTKQGGVGLGLAMVEKMVENHHGQISIESQKDKGTTIILRLPMNGRQGGVLWSNTS